MEKRLPPIVWIFSGGGAWVQELRCWEGLLPGLLGEEALEEGLGLGGGEEEEGSAGGGGGDWRGWEVAFSGGVSVSAIVISVGFLSTFFPWNFGQL